MNFLMIDNKSRFQTSGSHPGEDFDMQNPNLQSTVANSFNRARKMFKTHIYIYNNLLFTLFLCSFIVFHQIYS